MMLYVFFTKPLYNDYPWFSVCLFFPCIVNRIHQNPYTNGQHFHKIQQCRYLLNPWCDMETGPVSHWKRVWPVWFVCFHAVVFGDSTGVEPPSRRKNPWGVRETIQGSHRWGVGREPQNLVLLVGGFLLFQKEYCMVLFRMISFRRIFHQTKLGKLLHALVFATDFGQNFSSCICMIRPKFWHDILLFVASDRIFLRSKQT